MHLLELPVASETVAAQDRSVGTRLERHLTGSPALGAYRIIHLAGAVVAVSAASLATLTGVSAGFAALGLIRKTFFGEKLLLVGSKREFLSAIFADDGLVAKHQIPQKNIA